MNATQPINNEDLMSGIRDMMQMTSNGFIRLAGRMDRLEARMDGIEGRMEGLESRMDRIERTLQEIKTKLYEHDLQLAELRRITEDLANSHATYTNDTADLLDHVQALESKAPAITKAEVREVQRLLKVVVNWALKVAKTTKVPLQLT